MASSKTIERGATHAESFLHAPELNSSIHTFEGEITAEHHAALVLGRAIIASNFEVIVNSATHVEINHDKTIEARRSAHEVGFGAIVTRPEIGGPRIVRKSGRHPVALKPFTRPEKALDEMQGYLTLAELGVETYEPIGVFPAKNGDHFVAITKKRNDLTSLDRDTWVVGRQVIDQATAEVAERNNDTIKGIAKMMAYIHMNGVFHPDGQIKNYAKNPEGEIGIIDPENLLKLELNHEDTSERAWHDINKLVQSLIISTQESEEATLFGVGMLGGMPLHAVRNSIEELILNPYMESLGEALDDCEDDRLADQISILLEGIDSHFYNDEIWPDHFVEAAKITA